MNPNNLTFREFEKANHLRNVSPEGFNHPIDGWSLSDWAVAALGELGEAANVVKKLNRIRDGIPNSESETELREALGKEIADTFTYLDLFAQAAGYSLVDIVVNKFQIVSERIGYMPLLDRRRVYLAGPFFSPEQKATMAMARASLEASGYDVIDPQELSPVIVDLPPEAKGPALFASIYEKNVRGVEAADALVAYVGEKDTGTTFEMGYAAALGKPILTFSDEPAKLNVMLGQATRGHALTAHLGSALAEAMMLGRYSDPAAEAQINE